MKTVTGRDVVLGMFEMAQDMKHWHKRHLTKAALQKQLTELGLTAHQMEVLSFMHDNPELDTVSALASELFISKGSLSLMISKLQAAGFVQKKSAKSDDDGRKVYVSLTKKGVEAVKKTGAIVISSAAVAFDEMDDERRTLFYTKVNELKELFNAGGWKE